MKILFLSLLLFSSSALADYQWSAENPTYTQFQSPEPRVLTVSFISTDEWTSGDTYREITFLALHEIDRRQTLELIKTNYELNPFIGATPSAETVNNYFAVTALAHYGTAYILPAKWREIFQNTTISFAAFIAVRNYIVVGVRVPFK